MRRILLRWRAARSCIAPEQVVRRWRWPEAWPIGDCRRPTPSRLTVSMESRLHSFGASHLAAAATESACDDAHPRLERNGLRSCDFRLSPGRCACPSSSPCWGQKHELFRPRRSGLRAWTRVGRNALSRAKWLCLRPLSGGEADIQLLYPALEREPVRPARFDLPDPYRHRDAGCRPTTVRRAAPLLAARRWAVPSAARLAFEPRAYQLVPLLMALRCR